MNVPNAFTELSNEQLESVTGGRMFLVHERHAKEMADLLSPDAGNLSDYVDPFGPEGRKPYIG